MTPVGPVSSGDPTVLGPDEDLVTVVDQLDAPPRGWAAFRHQLALRRKVDRIARLYAESERMHRDALDLIRAENRALHRRALRAEGFIAYANLETAYGVSDTARRPVNPTMLALRDHAAQEATP